VNGIILSPEYQKLTEELERLRTELSMLMLERDNLLHVTCKNIEMYYMLKLGNLEYKVFQAQCAYLRLKRKLELIQAKKNRQEKIFISEIEEILDAEFLEYKKKLQEYVEKMKNARERSLWRELTDEEAGELKRLYRRIMKALHPDLNRPLTDAQLKMFHDAVEALEKGDLQKIRLIYEIVVELKPLEESRTSTMAQLAKEKERLIALVKNLLESIEKIKSEYPYTLKELIKDPEKIKARRAELERLLQQYKEAIAAYKARIEEMLR